MPVPGRVEPDEPVGSIDAGGSVDETALDAADDDAGTAATVPDGWFPA